MAAVTKIENSAKNHLKIIFSEIAEPIGPKLLWNGLHMVLFEKYIRRPWPPTKRAAVTKNKNYWANWAQTLVEWSLGGHLSELCPKIPSAIEDDHRYLK
jgi:hypothetical protein